jgi:hypothetical protein
MESGFERFNIILVSEDNGNLHFLGPVIPQTRVFLGEFEFGRMIKELND